MINCGRRGELISLLSGRYAGHTRFSQDIAITRLDNFGDDVPADPSWSLTLIRPRIHVIGLASRIVKICWSLIVCSRYIRFSFSPNRGRTTKLCPQWRKLPLPDQSNYDRLRVIYIVVGGRYCSDSLKSRVGATEFNFG